MTRLSHRPPLQALRTLRPDGADGAAELVVTMLGPGLMGGDRSCIEVVAEAGSRVRVRGQSATRVMRARDEEPSHAANEIRVGAGALVEWLPLPTILQAGADYRQDTRVQIDDGGAALVLDVVVPGRLARGERFAFAGLDARLEVRGARGELLVAERQRLRPEQGWHRHLGALAREEVVVASLFVLAPERSLQVPDGATELPNRAGYFTRALGRSAQDAVAAVEPTLRWASDCLGRTGRDAQ